MIDTRTRLNGLLLAAATAAPLSALGQAGAAPPAGESAGARSEAAAETRHPYAGPYVIAAGGRNAYDQVCFLFSCENTRSSAYKLGGGLRFGVAAVEAWHMDFGGGNFSGSGWFGGPRSVRIRTLGAGAAWAARLGNRFELTSRVGLGRARFTSGGAEPSHSAWRPYAGVTLGVRLGEQASAELGFDATSARRHEGEAVTAVALMGGVRLRF
jgi:hypothetical protein